jgi:sugar lactone lactonase YvrE
VAFSLAGEKMPWLTMHLALPMVLWGGWAIGKLIEGINWAELRERKAPLVIALLATFTIGIVVAFISLFGDPGPFAGKELAQLQATSTFLVSLVGAIVSAWGLYVLLKGWPLRQLASMAVVVFFALLAVQTIRTSIRANYILYDTGKEYLVYAHGFTGVKDVMRQISELSNKTTGDDHSIVIAYDNETSWPLSWYLRDFKNQKYYGGSPGVDLREVPAILVGDANYSKIEPIVGDKYYRFDYIRMVWPNQDYFNLISPRDASQPLPDDYACTGVLGVFRAFPSQDFARLCNAIANPQMRAAIWDIWFNRDYTKYAQVTGSDGTTLANWDPSAHMRLYIRKDVGQSIWKYGAAPVAAAEDPYLKATITLASDLTVGSAGTEPGTFNAPRGIAFAPDGTFYVADSRNHRIQHFGADGKVIKAWGTFGDNTDGKAPGGALNEPWGVAVGPDGSVYVTDTWNHRIQKFDANGTFIKMWGTFGLSDANTPGALYGPRGISVDAKGHVYVADTGNKRIAVFDSDGKFLTQFGSEGYEVGKFSEPVDVKLDTQGNVYVTDTWNQRVQVFSPSPDGLTFTPLRQWAINGWKSQSLDNKPYISVAPDGHVFATDPEGYRVLEFTSDGQFVQTWGAYGTDASSFGLASGIAVDAQGHVWVSDSANNRVLRFTVPAK